jgi:hypothetical protein
LKWCCVFLWQKDQIQIFNWVFCNPFHCGFSQKIHFWGSKHTVLESKRVKIG